MVAAGCGYFALATGYEEAKQKAEAAAAGRGGEGGGGATEEREGLLAT